MAAVRVLLAGRLGLPRDGDGGALEGLTREELAEAAALCLIEHGADPACVHVCDRLVLPGLHGRLAGLVDGSLSLDRETRAYVRASLGFRFVPVPDGATALAVERGARGGRLRAGKPLLNPL